MNECKTIIVIQGIMLLLVFILGYLLLDTYSKFKTDAVKHKCLQYNQKTGDLEWIRRNYDFN